MRSVAQPNPSGLCQCQCGERTQLATRNSFTRGMIKGEPLRFVSGHYSLMQMKSGKLTTSHGMRHTPEYSAYAHAQQRCLNPKDKNWANYGGRGIEFRFASFEQFFAELGPRPEGMTLDRKNNDGNYEPGNVRWATWEQQVSNKRHNNKHTKGRLVA